MEQNIFNEANKPILVKSTNIVKKLIFEYNFLDKLCGVKQDKYNPGRKVYFFEPDDNGIIKETLDKYLAEIAYDREQRNRENS